MATALNSPPVNIRSLTLSASGSSGSDSFSIPSGRWALVYIVRINFFGSGSANRSLSIAGSVVDSSTSVRTVEISDEAISNVSGFLLNSSDEIVAETGGIGSSITAVLRIIEFNNP